jgi:micrococcal nuclease
VAKRGAAPILTILTIGVVIVGVWWFGVRPGSEVCCADPAAQQTDAPAKPPDAFTVTVASVWDGDTLRARVAAPNDLIPTTDEVRVRLIGIDTPEVSAPAECWGDEATAHLRALAPQGSVLWASLDVDPLDRYERYLLYLWTDDGRFVNHELVAAGDAETLVVEPNDRYADLFEQAETTAQAAGAGRWGACG